MPYFKNDNVNILFIHIPKTGGTSIEAYFSNKFSIPLDESSLYDKTPTYEQFKTSPQHMTLRTIIHNTSFKINFNHIKIMTCVRNPYERLVSDLFYFDLIKETTTPSKVYTIILDYLTKNLLYDNHSLPQYMFLVNNKNEINKLIDICHTETLNEDMNKLGYTDFNIKINTNPIKLNYYKYLNIPTILLINKIYEKDFKLFGYKMIIPNTEMKMTMKIY